MDKELFAQSINIKLENWQRVSPFAVAYYFFQHLLNMLRSGFYILPVLALNADKVKANLGLIVPIAVCIMLLVLVSSIATYLAFKFKLTDEKIMIRSGVFKRQSIDLPYKRIQSVKVVQPFFFRFTQHAVTTLDTAGSSEQEATLAALALADANVLKDHVMRLTRASSDTDKVEGEGTAPVVLNTRKTQDLIIHGVTNNRVWLIVGAMSPFFDDVFEWLSAWLSKQGWQAEQIFDTHALAWWQLSVYAFSAVLIVGVVVACISVLGAIVTFYNYRLEKQGDRYVRKSGLFTVQEVSMRHSRLQTIKLQQNWLDCVLGRFNFFYIQNTTGVANAADAMQANKILVPSVTTLESQALATEAMPECQLNDTPYLPISQHYLVNRILVKALPLFLLFAYLASLATSVNATLVVCTGFILICFAIYLRWKRWGVYWDDDYAYVRSGIVGVNQQCFERFKLQQVTLHQSWFMRRNNLASVECVLASGSVTIPYLNVTTANNLVHELVTCAQRSNKPWM